MPTQRLFLALWPSFEARDALALCASRLIGDARCKPVPLEQLHMTLAFLGDVTPPQRRCLEARLEEIRLTPFMLTLSHASVASGRGGILWLTPDETPAPLTRLAAALKAAAEGCGLPQEARPYRAHVTLARRLRDRPVDTPIAPISWEVEGFSLVSSQMQKGGPVYKALGGFG